MDFLPLFFDLKDQQVLVFGETAAATRKVELLLRAQTKVFWVCNAIPDGLVDHPEQSLERVNDPELAPWEQVHMVVAATEDEQEDELIAQRAIELRLPVNVVNRPHLSSFIFPSIIDRSPVLAAVASGGELPVLTRLLRNRLESSIPHAYGRLALLAKRYREQARKALPSINARRRFWEGVLEGRFADLVFSGREREAEELLHEALEQATEDQTPVGEVYLVGAGPGDPDLLTFKALRLIRQADVVLYDRLVSEQIMALVRQDAEKIDVGKARSNHTLPQDSINDLLIEHAKQGKRVLRLKGGDPFIFGRGGEEIEKLAEQGVPFQVVPGITAASGCAAYAGIPLTHRDYSQSVRFITGHLKDDSCNLPWNEFVHPHQTLVFYMGLVGLPIITRELIAHGMANTTPVALISKGTTRDQRVLVGDLSDISELAVEEGVKAPTLIIIGEVVNLRSKLNWHD